MLTRSSDAVALLRELEQMNPATGPAEIVEAALLALKERNETGVKADEDLRFGRDVE